MSAPVGLSQSDKRNTLRTVMTSNSTAKQNGMANLGSEQTLWAAANKIRDDMDTAKYKHVVRRLIFLKYISDAFAEQHAKLTAEKGADPEDRDGYLAVNCVWVPVEARWSYRKAKAKQPTFGKHIDDALSAIVSGKSTRNNPGVFRSGFEP